MLYNFKLTERNRNILNSASKRFTNS